MAVYHCRVWKVWARKRCCLQFAPRFICLQKGQDVANTVVIRLYENIVDFGKAKFLSSPNETGNGTVTTVPLPE